MRVLALENVLTCHYVKHGMECKPTVLAYVVGVLLCFGFAWGFLTIVGLITRGVR